MEEVTSNEIQAIKAINSKQSSCEPILRQFDDLIFKDTEEEKGI